MERGTEKRERQGVKKDTSGVAAFPTDRDFTAQRSLNVTLQSSILWRVEDNCKAQPFPNPC